MATRATEQQITSAKKTRDLLEVKVEAAELQRDLARLTKGIGSPDGDGGAPRPIDRVREAFTSGLEIKAFQQALGSTGNGGETVPNQETTQKVVEQTSETRSRIVETLVKAGKSPKEIEEYLTQLGPSLELAGLARDPMSQLLLYSRFNQKPADMNVKDVMEVITMVEKMKGDSGGKSDLAAFATSMVEAFKAGKESVQTTNPGTDSFTAYQAGMENMQKLLAGQTIALQAQFQERIKSLEEKLAGSDPIAYIKQMKESAEVLGLGGTDKDLALARLDMDNKRHEREFEREKTLFEMERREKEEARKDKRTSGMLDRVMKGVETALESPVIKEAGKMVGSKLEGKVPDVRGAAARQQLSQPLQEVKEFTCPKCQKTTQFSNADLVAIANRGGRWVCPTQGCGTAYNLPKEGSA